MNNLYYVVLMAWSVAYLFMSFITPLPWVKKSFIGRPDDFKESDVDADDLESKKLQAAAFFNKDFFAEKCFTRLIVSTKLAALSL